MNLNIDIPVEMEGLFNLEVIRPDGSSKQTGWFKNLILNQGLNRLGSAGTGAIWTACQVGTDNTTPAVGNTTLGARIAGTSSRSSSTTGVDSVGGFVWLRNTYEFAEGAAAGVLAEVGVGWSTTGNLFSRALIKDSGGEPTTITVLSDEILRVTWEHRRYWPTADVTGTIVNTGNRGGSFDWIARTADTPNWALSENQGGISISTSSRIFYYGGDLGSITGNPTGVSSSSNTVTSVSYVADSYSASAIYSFALAEGNTSPGIKALLPSFNNARFQIGFTPMIGKTAADLLSITVRCTWARRA